MAPFCTRLWGDRWILGSLGPEPAARSRDCEGRFRFEPDHAGNARRRFEARVLASLLRPGRAPRACSRSDSAIRPTSCDFCPHPLLLKIMKSTLESCSHCPHFGALVRQPADGWRLGPQGLTHPSVLCRSFCLVVGRNGSLRRGSCPIVAAHA